MVLRDSKRLFKGREIGRAGDGKKGKKEFQRRGASTRMQVCENVMSEGLSSR